MSREHHSVDLRLAREALRSISQTVQKGDVPVPDLKIGEAMENMIPLGTRGGNRWLTDGVTVLFKGPTETQFALRYNPAVQGKAESPRSVSFEIPKDYLPLAQGTELVRFDGLKVKLDPEAHDRTTKLDRDTGQEAPFALTAEMQRSFVEVLQYGLAQTDFRTQ